MIRNIKVKIRLILLFLLLNATLIGCNIRNFIHNETLDIKGCYQTFVTNLGTKDITLIKSMFLGQSIISSDNKNALELNEFLDVYSGMGKIVIKNIGHEYIKTSYAGDIYDKYEDCIAYLYDNDEIYYMITSFLIPTDMSVKNCKILSSYIFPLKNWIIHNEDGDLNEIDWDSYQFMFDDTDRYADVNIDVDIIENNPVIVESDSVLLRELEFAEFKIGEKYDFLDYYYHIDNLYYYRCKNDDILYKFEVDDSGYLCLKDVYIR